MPLPASATYTNRFEHPIIPGENPKDQEYPTQTHTHTFTGLPPNSKAVLVDTLSTVRENMGQETALTVATFIVPSSGTFTATGLRPSIYSLIFSELKYRKYNHNKFTIGDPKDIQAYRHFKKPLQLDVTATTSGLLANIPYIDLTWAPKAGGTIASSKVLYSGEGASLWTTYLDTRDPLIRSTRVIPLDSGLDYTFKVQSYNSDGNFSESTAQTLKAYSKLPVSGSEVRATFGVNTYQDDNTTLVSDANVLNENVVVADITDFDTEVASNATVSGHTSKLATIAENADVTADAGAFVDTINVGIVATQADGVTSIPTWTNDTESYVVYYSYHFRYGANVDNIEFSARLKTDLGLDTCFLKQEIFSITAAGALVTSAEQTFTNTSFAQVDVTDNSSLTLNNVYRVDISVKNGNGEITSFNGGSPSLTT